jgi:uncharacterized metal-binding protein YceD (DUF177 family)
LFPRTSVARCCGGFPPNGRKIHTGMALLVNLRRLEREPIHLRGRILPAELEIERPDEVTHVRHPLVYDVEAQMVEKAVLVQGTLEMTLDCECVRCLKPFTHRIQIKNWTCHLALEGEETVAVVNDTVDLTPPMREDMLLEFPQHPLCEAECGGLPRPKTGRKANTGGAGQTKDSASAWAELNKLKF